MAYRETSFVDERRGFRDSSEEEESFFLVLFLSSSSTSKRRKTVFDDKIRVEMNANWRIFCSLSSSSRLYDRARAHCTNVCIQRSHQLAFIMQDDPHAGSSAHHWCSAVVDCHGNHRIFFFSASRRPSRRARNRAEYFSGETLRGNFFWKCSTK